MRGAVTISAGMSWSALRARTLVVLLGAALVVLVLAVAVPTVAWAADEEPICVACHTNVSLEVVDTWRSQNHGRNGVTCVVCHNTHDSDFRPQPTVEVCMGCHDVAAIHGEFLPETSAERCMDCHTSNVHLLPGQASWFYGGLPTDKLTGDEPPEDGEIAASTGRSAGVIGAAVVVLLGLALGFVVDRFVRNL